jgi:hypothetical protein
MRKDYQEYYRVLNLNPGATPAEIKRSYHQIIRRWHPDLFKPGSLMQKTAEDITKETNEAFEQLFKKRHYRNFPPPGEAPPPKPARAVRRPPPKAPRKRSAAKWAARGARRFAAWPWRKIAAAALVATVVFAGVALRANIRGLFYGDRPAPAAAAAAVAMVTPTKPGEREIPDGLATVSVPIAVATGEPSHTDIAPVAEVSARSNPIPVSVGRASRPRPERSQRADEPKPEQASITFSAPGPENLQSNGPRSILVGQRASSRLPERELARWPTTETCVHASAPSPTLPSADLGRILDEATARLSTFGVGDSKARVLEIQGKPDEDLGSVLRYGSSLVYFANGWVRNWSDRYPRLNIRRWPTIPMFQLGFFEQGSDRSEVIRAQGMPTGVTSYGYTYGTSFVFFENDRVAVFGDGDQRLNSLVLPTLPRLDVDQLP